MSLKTVALLALGAATGGACALAAHADPQAAGAVWIEAPTVADFAAAYPAKAKAANIGGTVTLTCEIGRDLHPRDCDALKEKPGLYGFAPAARKIAEKLKAGEADMIGQNVFIPVTFDPAVLTGAAMVTKPAWTAAPAIDDYRATFPKTENGVNDVRVVLGCTVEGDGSLGACAVAQETPAGQGYGAGALALASKFRMAPWSTDGEPTVGAKIKLPIHYVLKPVAPPAAK
jgi:hypothetical protein